MSPAVGDRSPAVVRAGGNRLALWRGLWRGELRPELDPACLERIARGHAAVSRAAAGARAVYGLNTGFGKLALVRIPADRLAELVGRRVLDPLLRRYIGGWLDAQILNGVDGVPTKAGACQGSVLSPLLANVYLHEVDRLLVARKLALVRYADNLLICCRRKAEAEEAMAVADEALAAWSLRLNEHKTRIVHFDQGFAWLGHFMLRGECFRI